MGTDKNAVVCTKDDDQEIPRMAISRIVDHNYITIVKASKQGDKLSSCPQLSGTLHRYGLIVSP